MLKNLRGVSAARRYAADPFSRHSAWPTSRPGMLRSGKIAATIRHMVRAHEASSYTRAGGRSATGEALNVELCILATECAHPRSIRVRVPT